MKPSLKSPFQPFIPSERLKEKENDFSRSQNWQNIWKMVTNQGLKFLSPVVTGNYHETKIVETSGNRWP